jgi:hypothetical protein
VTERPVIFVYDEHGQRLYTAQQLADMLGITRSNLLVRLTRGQAAEPAGWVDQRTAVWHEPEEKR